MVAVRSNINFLQKDRKSEKCEFSVDLNIFQHSSLIYASINETQILICTLRATLVFLLPCFVNMLQQ